MREKPISVISQVLKYLSTGWRFRTITMLLILLSIATIAGLVWNDWDEISNYSWDFRYEWLVFAIVGWVVAHGLGAYAWHWMVNRFINPLSWRTNFACWGYSNLAKRLPTPVWYISSRATLYEKHGVNKAIITFLSTLELCFILISGTLTATATLPFWSSLFIESHSAESSINLWLILLAVGLLAITIHPRTLNWLWSKLSKKQNTYTFSWRDIILGGGYFTLMWLLGAWMLFSIIQFTGQHEGLSYLIVLGIWSAANIVSLAGSLAFFGFGLRDISLVVMLSQLLANAPLALILAVLVRVIFIFGELIGGIIAIWLQNNPKTSESPPI